MKRICCICLVFFALAGRGVAEASARSVEITYDSESDQIGFAVGDLVRVLEDQKIRAVYSPGASAGRIVVLTAGALASEAALVPPGVDVPQLSGLGEQSFLIGTEDRSGVLCHTVVGGDETGAMYGVLELAERIQNDGWGRSYAICQAPCIRYRGMKLNMPLDRRIPTYVGGWSSSSTKRAIPHVWDMAFWKELIDAQARARYNVLSVWVHHPFPALVRVAEYPRATLPAIEGFDGYVKDWDCETRIAFWREVMRYAHSRGMKFYFFNWNIYVDYAQSQYSGITRSQENPVTVDYTYRSMQALIDTYPELDGFGISGGDGMSADADTRSKTEWTYSVYGRAVADYCRAHPEREFLLIHRRLGTTPDLWDELYSPLDSLGNVTREFSSKYSQAHMYSTTAPQWSVYDIRRIRQLGKRTWLTIRNDDYFYFDWGDPSFVRDYIRNIPCKDAISGLYIGSDGYTPARGYLCRDSVLQKMLDVQRRWYMETLWGRLSYNPDLDDQTLISLIGHRYPGVDARRMYEAWALASRSLPRVTELVVKDWDLDFEWYPEACSSDPGRCSGFRTIEDFAQASPADGSRLCGITASARGETDGLISTYSLADTMASDATRSLVLVSSLSSGGDRELTYKIANIRQMAYLSLYYSHKIRGATFKQAGRRSEACAEMKKASDYWFRYTRLMDEYYYPDSFRNVEIVPDWHFADEEVLQEYRELR